MAQNITKVLLGFEDELINEKYKSQINFTTNKIGGKPDLPCNIKLELPICPLCQLPRPLVVQIYAPLENCAYHRTLYLFACINPNCWNHNESWICFRVQTQEKISTELEEPTPVASKTSATDWCSDADDWDDNNANLNEEENGNMINSSERVSDEDDESCSFEESVRNGLGNLTIDDRNANNGAFVGGAVGRLHSPSASAEIEGDEGEVISIDSPIMPQHDIVALLQEVTPLPQELCTNIDTRKTSLFQFISFFMNVWEETSNAPISDRHVKELLQEYQHKYEDDLNLSPDSGGASAQITDNAFEKYEKSNPAHGDKIFHHFLSRIQMNPGQILRYNRDNNPLLLYPLPVFHNKCNYCQGEIVFEFQVMPTIISKLKLIGDVKNGSRLEFGTVLVFTCRKSCWTSDTNPKYETVIVQSETY